MSDFCSDNHFELFFIFEPECLNIIQPGQYTLWINETVRKCSQFAPGSRGIILGVRGSHFGLKIWAKFPEAINMAKQIRTENLYTVPGSKFLKYACGNHHFARSLQKITVFNEKLYVWSLTNFKKMIFWKLWNFQRKHFVWTGSKFDQNLIKCWLN